MRTVLIVGYKGNMGRRYAAILDRLNVEWIGMDQGDLYPSKTFEGIILCTPTAVHAENLNHLLDYNVPILCEKPVVKDPEEVVHLVNAFDARRIPLRMVNQYEYMHGPIFDSHRITTYNYFKTGNDGLAWDCINIIGLAQGPCYINNTSPIWQCTINGSRMFYDRVDLSYLDMMSDWLANPTDNGDYIIEAHRKAHEYDQKVKQGLNWDSSKVYQ